MTRTPTAATSRLKHGPALHGDLSRFVEVGSRLSGDAFQARALAVPVEPNLRLSRRYRAAVAIAKNKPAGAGYLLPDGAASNAPISLLLATFAIAWFVAHFIMGAA